MQDKETQIEAKFDKFRDNTESAIESIVFDDVRFMTKDDLNKVVLSLSEKFTALKKEINILNVEPDEFVDFANEFATKQLQEHFITDAAILGLDSAVKHYSKYSLFSENWSTTLKQRIHDLVKARSDFNNAILTNN